MLFWDIEETCIYDGGTTVRSLSIIMEIVSENEGWETMGQFSKMGLDSE